MKEGKEKNKIHVFKEKRVKTGVRNFDDLIQGGFVKNSTNLLVGRGGSGKSIFTIQFMMQGIREGEKCLFISFEEKRGEFFSHMKAMGVDLEKHSKEGKFFFLEYTPQKVKTMLDEGGGAIEALVLNEGITRVVIDSVSSLMMLFGKELEQKEVSFNLSSILKGWNCTTLLTYEENLIFERDSSRIFDLVSDTIILFYFLRSKNKRIRSLEIMKMRGTKHSLSLHPFEIINGGITVSKKPLQAYKFL
jgi:circadian clock protein KaiC